ncbi:hypothetical protein G6F68_014089 [Rhizopus microsporus]|nr:hypothetical protein G6F68_014089 [Rhizopus microsporus]
MDLDEAHPPHLRHVAGEAGIAALGHERLHHLLHAPVQVIRRHLQHFTHGLPRAARRHRQYRQADQRQHDRIQVWHPVVPLAAVQDQRQHEGQHHGQAHQSAQQPATHVQPQQRRAQAPRTLRDERGHCQVAGTQQRRPPQRGPELHFVPARESPHRVPPPSAPGASNRTGSAGSVPAPPAAVPTTTPASGQRRPDCRYHRTGWPAIPPAGHR